GLAHQLVDRLGHDAAAIDLLEVADRNLAGPKAAQLDAILELRQAVVEPRIKFGRGHDHLELALQAVGVGFSYLHGSNARRFALKSQCPNSEVRRRSPRPPSELRNERTLATL